MSLIGKKPPDGSTVTDELCRCGHSVRDHKGAVCAGVPVPGAGACKTCDCERFTWARFVTAPEGGETE